MRYFFLLLFIILLFAFAQKILALLIKGKLFDAEARRASLAESGKTLWLGARMFVILWLLYLLLNWWVRRGR